MAHALAADRHRTAALPVTGMTCAGCARRVEAALATLPGVVEAEVNVALDLADVTYDARMVAPEDLLEATKAAGFGVRQQAHQLQIGGMTCASCARRVEQALLAIPGVVHANVNAATEAAEVRALPGEVSTAALVAAVNAAGFSAAPVAEAASGEAETRAKARRDLIELAVAVVLTLPLVAQMGLMGAGVGWHLPAWVELTLAAPVQLWVGRRFYSASWTALRHRAGTMDQLVAIGTSAAFLYSLWLVLTLGAEASGQLYFEASAVIITLVLLGKVLEARAKRSASAALRELMALRPSRARLLRGGAEAEVAIAEVAVGDIVLVRPGERLPVDGVIVKGESELDESLLTGESVPVARHVGDPVVAGAINGLGLLRVRTEHVGDDTTLAKVARLVAQAQAGKAPIQRLVDRISAIFVPIVLVLAALTLGGWLLAGAGVEQALIAAVSVLVIACPCALGLATPTALVAGTGAAAKAGILIRDIETLERAHHIDVVVFDKTGTLTRGQPTVQRILPTLGTTAETLLALAASAQRGSEHPLGKAMVAAAEARGLTLADAERFEARVGQGVAAQVDGHAVRVGRATLTGTDPSLVQAALDGEAAGLTMTWVARDGEVVGLIGLADEVREDAAHAVAELRAREVAVVLLTGDNRRTAARIGAELGIDQVAAEVTPDAKARHIRALAARGLRVAMVGDGINDAPALAAADLAIAMGGGADVALETAGATLMRPKPALVAATLDIAARTRRKVRQNLFWAFIYNVVGLPIAALGLLSPMVAGAAMAASSVCVVTNALLLKRWTPAGGGRS